MLKTNYPHDFTLANAYAILTNKVMSLKWIVESSITTSVFKKCTWILLTISLCLTVNAEYGGLQKLENLRLVPHPSNDGDSFRVTDGESEWYLRLYFVDAPETSADSETMVRRLREQTRYFGLARHEDTIRFGVKAHEAVKEWLAEPFTAYTVFADAMGRSVMPRIFAFVVTAEGKQLDQLLVANGLARNYGVGRADHLGVSRNERTALLNDLEAAAMLRRVGIWGLTDPELITSLRAREREEIRELDQIRAELGLGNLPEGETLSLNQASLSELQRLPGIGPALAERIVNGRPYTSINDLLSVSGIGPATLERLRPFLEID